MKRVAKLLILSCALVLLMGADNNRYEKVGGKIMCTCGCSEMLLKCNHVGCPNSDTMIRQLRSQLQASNNDNDVLNFFRRTWGITAVVEPGTHGFELLIWVLPPLVLGLGLLLVILVVRKLRLRASPAGEITLDPHLEALRQRARRETEV